MPRVSLDLRDFQNQMKRAGAVTNQLPQDTLDHFRAETPIRSGNARRNTRLQKDTVLADYAYAQRLDEGYSKQAPEGMVAPTVEWLVKEVEKRLKGI